MWLFKSRERFSLEELKHLNEQLQRYPVVTDSNKEAVVEILRSMSELMIWGDQHEPAFFEYFMEKQVLAHFLRILRNSSKKTGVAEQLLQTLSIMIQNIRSQQAIYYMFSGEHINHLISFPFDFKDEEVLAYYISFLKTISMKLDESTVSFFIKTLPDGTISFPLYREAIKFVHHEEGMVRIAVRTLTLNVYNVKSEIVRSFILSSQVVSYFSDLVKYLAQQSHALDGLVTDAAEQPLSSASYGRLEAGTAEWGDLLFYCNDILSADLPEARELMTEHILNILILPLLLPSLALTDSASSPTLPPESMGLVSPLCSMYLLSRILHVVSYKPLLDGIVAAVLSVENPGPSSLADNADVAEQEAARRLSGSEAASSAISNSDRRGERGLGVARTSSTPLPKTGSGSGIPEDQVPSGCARELILHYIMCGEDKLVLAGLCILVSLLQNKVMDEGLLDALGILPQKRRIYNALVGNTSDEELKEILAPGSRGSEGSAREMWNSPEHHTKAERNAGKEEYHDKRWASDVLGGGKAMYSGDDEEREASQFCSHCGGLLMASGATGGGSGRGKAPRVNGDAILRESNGNEGQHKSPASKEASSGGWRSWLLRFKVEEGELAGGKGRCLCGRGNPRRNRKEVLDALIKLLCRRPPQCAEALWHAGWLIHKLMPNADQLKLSGHSRLSLLDGAYVAASDDVLGEVKDCWVDVLPDVIKEEWRVCKKELENPSLQRDSSFVLMPSTRLIFPPGDMSSGAVGERMRTAIKVFVALHQMRLLLRGKEVDDVPPLGPPPTPPLAARTNRKPLGKPSPAEGAEVELAARNAIPCKVAFERGKERAMFLIANSYETSGALLLAEATAGRVGEGLVRVSAPLAGCSPRKDEKHPRWLHLRIRSPHAPSANAGMMGLGASVSDRDKANRIRRLADGRWTLAFVDEMQCQLALRAITEELAIQSFVVREMLKPILGNTDGLREQLSRLEAM